MIRRLFCLSLALLLPTVITAQEIKPEAGFAAVLDISGFSSKASVPDIENTQFKGYKLQLNLPVNIYLSDTLLAEAEPFAKTYYKNGKEDARHTSLNFQKAALVYKTDNFLLKIGRQGFEKYNKNLIIYYGPYDNIITKGPTALDGLRNTFSYGVFYYDILLGKEAAGLAWDNPQSILGGVELGADIKDFFNFNVFAYKKNRIEHEGLEDGETLVYGAGTDVHWENADFAITGALSRNDNVKVFTFDKISRKFKGHIINAMWNLKKDTPLFVAKYRLRATLISQDNSHDKRYAPISSYNDFGYIFSGNAAGENIGFNSEGASVYGAGADFTPQDFKNITFAFDLYNYKSAVDDFTNKDLGYEVDAALSYYNTFCKLTLYYAYFSGGQALKEYS